MVYTGPHLFFFTNDPNFRDEGVSTTRRKKIRSECDAMFDKYGVSPNQVIWLGGHSYYVPESRALLEMFEATIQLPPIQ